MTAQLQRVLDQLDEQDIAIAWQAGLSYPLFWAVLGFVLNSLVFIGPLIVSAFLFAIGLLTSATALGAFLPAAIYYGIHLIEGNAVAPVAVGRDLDIPAFFVFASFVFGLWGPLGAILSTPILIVAAVLRDGISNYHLAEDKAVADTASQKDLNYQ